MKKNSDSTYHEPVLLKRCMEELITDPNGVYVDVTFGGGGHSREILKHLVSGSLYAFDQDKDAVINQIKDKNFLLLNQNFRYMNKFLQFHKISQVNGILADLGVSSYQINEPSKGFSYRSNALLDMRMNQGQDLTAKKVVNEYSEDKLNNIFRTFGEIKNHKSLTEAILQERSARSIETTTDLTAIAERYAPKKAEYKYFSKVFQALRIEVNDEINALKDFLQQTSQILKKGGRLVVISYHSLEDRLVKNFLRYGDSEASEYEKDFYGNILRPFKPLSNKVIIPSEEEIDQNSRARSAKLRVGIKL